VKKLTDEEIAKEDHDLGECGSGCKWCHEAHQEVMRALYPPLPGFYASRFMTIGFRA
jgi:hypothetical protein